MCWPWQVEVWVLLSHAGPACPEHWLVLPVQMTNPDAPVVVGAPCWVPHGAPPEGMGLLLWSQQRLQRRPLHLEVCLGPLCSQEQWLLPVCWADCWCWVEGGVPETAGVASVAAVASCGTEVLVAWLSLPLFRTFVSFFAALFL